MGTLSASGADVLRWREEGREDILAWVVPLGEGDDRKVRGQEKYNCTIYETRPETCRRYPQAVGHMKSVDCEMLEAGDTDADVRRFMRRPPEKAAV